MITVRRKVVILRRSDKTRAIVPAAAVPRVVAPGRVPRIARLMALAIHCDRLIREGKVADQSALARLVHVTQPRMTQVMNLNHLAPDIQETLLHLPTVTRGREPITERDLRALAAEVDWRRQRTVWGRLRSHKSIG